MRTGICTFRISAQKRIGQVCECTIAHAGSCRRAVGSSRGDLIEEPRLRDGLRVVGTAFRAVAAQPRHAVRFELEQKQVVRRCCFARDLDG